MVAPQLGLQLQEFGFDRRLEVDPVSTSHPADHVLHLREPRAVAGRAVFPEISEIIADQDICAFKPQPDIVRALPACVQEMPRFPEGTRPTPLAMADSAPIDCRY